ncbi:hypothetical protein KM043_002287 [Ampulex compressa]|nr:hypothetical protein KM043_002287 [Ampulex compressa]
MVHIPHGTSRRFKHGRKKSTKADIDTDDEDEDSDEDNMNENDVNDKSKKIITGKVQSIRMETVVKVALGMSRRKLEEAFYKGHIRINGEKLLKKGNQLRIDDEIDYIVSRSPENPDFLIVHRMVLLAAKPFKDAIQIKISREKSLLIENYDDPWKGGH